MRQSAKFNVFLGVLNLNEEFLLERLAFLSSFLRQKPMDLLVPLSVTAAMIGARLLAERAAGAAGDPFRLASRTLICTMLVLAVIEHWFLVLPLPFADLWRWMVQRRVSETATTCEDACAHEGSRPGVSMMPGYMHWSPPVGCGDIGAAFGPLARVARSLGTGVGVVRAMRIDRGFRPIGATARHWADAWGK